MLSDIVCTALKRLGTQISAVANKGSNSSDRLPAGRPRSLSMEWPLQDRSTHIQEDSLNVAAAL